MRAPSQEPQQSRFLVVIAVVAVFITWMAGTVSNKICGTVRPIDLDPQDTNASSVCQAVWNIKLIAQPHADLVTSNAPDAQPKIHDELDQNVKPAPKKRNFLAKLFSRRRSKQTPKSSIALYPNSFSVPDVTLTHSQTTLVKELGQRLRQSGSGSGTPDWERRAVAVPWGGPGGMSWWMTSDGGASLLQAHLKIMKWPQDLVTHFPFRLCSSKGCPAEASLAHTLEWREKYKPWCISPSVMQKNKNGFVYYRGYSPSLQNDGTGHTLVWLRLALQPDLDPLHAIRAIVNTLERAVADSLQRTNGKVGRFNCVIDGQGYKLSMLMGMGAVQRLVTMLQDHFPDRLGVVLMTNFSRPAQIFLGLVKPIITKDVREKLFVLPDDPNLRATMLGALIGTQFQPDFLGGTADKWKFDSNAYYSSRKHYCTDAESTEFLTTMPYHAK